MHTLLATQPTAQGTQRPQSNVRWKQLQSLPNKMLLPQVVPTKNTIYVGGGLGNTCQLSLQAFAYNIAEDTWRTLPETQTALFGMCIFQDSLVTVGGVCEEGITGKVYRLNEDRKWWDNFLPNMPTKRFSLSIFSGNSEVLVACGGGTWRGGEDAPIPCSTVEVYSQERKIWLSATSLPRPCAAMSCTFAGQTYYLLGDTDPGEMHGPMYANFAEIMDPEGDSRSHKKEGNSKSHKKSHPKVTKECSVICHNSDAFKIDWHHFPPPPVANTSIIATNSYLLAVGGHTDKGTVTAIHLYIKESQEWWQLAQGELPQGLEGCGLAVLDQTGEVIVVGGEDSSGMLTDSVFIGNLL